MNFNTKDVCLIIVVNWVCITIFMMVTANNPSADDFWRAVGNTGIGATATLGLTKVLTRKRKGKEEDEH